MVQFTCAVFFITNLACSHSAVDAIPNASSKALEDPLAMGPSLTEDVTAPPKRPDPKDNPIACTMEAKQCPDGSYVGRTGPNCEFTPCPDQEDLRSSPEER